MVTLGTPEGSVEKCYGGYDCEDEKVTLRWVKVFWQEGTLAHGSMTFFLVNEPRVTLE